MNLLFNKFFFIKKLCTLLVLFIFILGITPKKTLHNWFANHKDTTSSAPSDNAQKISKAGFNCNCDDLVAESHFIIFGSVVIINFPSVSPLTTRYYSLYFSSAGIHYHLRGPPFTI